MIILHDETTAPEPARTTLAAVKQANGFIPNIFRAMANSPASLNGFVAIVGTNDDGTLSPAERQIVQLAASIENESRYCVAGHSTFAESIGMPEDMIAAMRNGDVLDDAKYQVLTDFTKSMVRKRGQISADERAEMHAAGYSSEQIIEVVIGVALKTVTNFMSGAFELPLDGQFQAYEWAPPSPESASSDSHITAAA